MEKGFIFFVLLWMAPALPATFTVTNTNDSGANSLRDAIDQANANSDSSNTINITATGTITLASPLPVIQTNPAATTRATTINGPGPSVSSLTISGNSLYRAFTVDAVNVTINALMLDHCFAIGTNGGGGGGGAASLT